MTFSRVGLVLVLVIGLSLSACSSPKTNKPGAEPFVSAYFGTNEKATFPLDKDAQAEVDSILNAKSWPITTEVSFTPQDVVLVMKDDSGDVYHFIRTSSQALVSVTFDRDFVPTYYTLGTVVLTELVDYLMTLRTDSGVGLDPFTPVAYYLGSLTGYSGAKLTLVDAAVGETLRSYMATNQWVKTTSVTLQGAKPDIVLSDDNGTLYLFASGVGKTLVGVDTDVTEAGMVFYSAPQEVIQSLKAYFTAISVIEKANVNLANLRYSTYVLGDGLTATTDQFEVLSTTQSTAFKELLKLSGRVSPADQTLYQVPIALTLVDSTGVMFRFARIGDRVLIGADYKPTSYGTTYYWVSLDDSDPFAQALTYLEFISTQGTTPEPSVTGVEFTHFYVGTYATFDTAKLKVMSETVKKDVNGFVLKDYWRLAHYVPEQAIVTEFILADAVGTLFYFRNYAGVTLFKMEEGPWVYLPSAAYRQTFEYLKTVR
jgi:hypothetical protein